MDRYLEGMKSFDFYVADDGETGIIGILILNINEGEVYGLYIAPKAASQGLANVAPEYGRGTGQI